MDFQLLKMNKKTKKEINSVREFFPHQDDHIN